MATTTTNYGFDIPQSTDLVKDGATAIATLGQDVDTQLKALNPSTTLGDIEYRSSTANTNTRLPIGTTGQVLTVASGVPAWATPAPGGGKVLQVVSTAKTDTFSTSSTSFVDVTGLSVSITPSSTSSKILVIAQIMSSGTLNVNNAALKLVRGSTDISIGDAAGNRRRVSAYSSTESAFVALSSTISFLDSPSTTSSTTYKIQQTCLTSGNAYVNRTSNDTDQTDFCRGASTITVMEIGA